MKTFPLTVGMTPKEIWKDAVGWVGYYQVSNIGNVRSLDRVVRKHEHRGRVLFKKISGKILRPGRSSAGYLTVALLRGGCQKSHTVHRLVAEAFIPNPQELPCVNHKNEVRSYNWVENLEWVSKSENSLYSIRNGTNKCVGEGHPTSKLKAIDIPIIRESNKTLEELAAIYGVKSGAISSVKRRKNWKSVK